MCSLVKAFKVHMEDISKDKSDKSKLNRNSDLLFTKMHFFLLLYQIPKIISHILPSWEIRVISQKNLTKYSSITLQKNFLNFLLLTILTGARLNSDLSTNGQAVYWLPSAETPKFLSLILIHSFHNFHKGDTVEK